MQKTILYLLLLVILGGGVYYFLFNKEENVFGTTEAGFQIKDTSRIGKIFLVRTSGESIKLERKDGTWMVNEKYKALSGITNMMLQTLCRQEAVAPVPEGLHNTLVKAMAGNSVKVEVYDREGKKLTVFYVGGEAANYSGTFMLKEGAKKPYVVQIKNFEGVLTPRYSTDIRDWRDRTVFDFKPDEIKSIKVQYPDQPLNSFTLIQNGKVEVKTEPGVAGSNSLNEKRTLSYLEFFANVNCEGYLMGVPGMDSLLSTTLKRCIIDVAANSGKQHVEIYWMPLTRSKNLLQNNSQEVPEGFDADRYYAVINNGMDTAIIQRFTFDKLFRKASNFISLIRRTNTAISATAVYLAFHFGQNDSYRSDRKLGTRQ